MPLDGMDSIAVSCGICAWQPFVPASADPAFVGIVVRGRGADMRLDSSSLRSAASSSTSGILSISCSRVGTAFTAAIMKVLIAIFLVVGYDVAAGIVRHDFHPFSS